jgi:hypothetical protein
MTIDMDMGIDMDMDMEVDMDIYYKRWLDEGDLSILVYLLQVEQHSRRAPRTRAEMDNITAQLDALMDMHYNGDYITESRDLDDIHPAYATIYRRYIERGDHQSAELVKEHATNMRQRVEPLPLLHPYVISRVMHSKLTSRHLRNKSP